MASGVLQSRQEQRQGVMYCQGACLLVKDLQGNTEAKDFSPVFCFSFFTLDFGTQGTFLSFYPLATLVEFSAESLSKVQCEGGPISLGFRRW